MRCWAVKTTPAWHANIGAHRGKPWFVYEREDHSIFSRGEAGGDTVLNANAVPYNDADILARLRVLYTGGYGPLAVDGIVPSKLAPGTYCKRVWLGDQAGTPPGHLDHLFESVQAARSIFDQLFDAFQVVQPHPVNSKAFGFRFRELLILACTEVENAWKAILVANGHASPGDRLTTNQYVKLLKPLRLNEWTIRMPMFQKFGDIRPFGTWKATDPTSSLDWYSAYNNTKHDRENGLPLATVERATSAAAAVVVMLAAQAGLTPFSGGTLQMRHFLAIESPQWEPEEVYVPALEYEPVPGTHFTQPKGGYVAVPLVL